MQSELDSYVDDNFNKFIDELNKLVAQPSISTTGEGIEECADMVSETVKQYGMDKVHKIETNDHPAIIASAEADSKPQETDGSVLIYGHYDVQPVTPSEWTSPPFEPTIRGGPDGTKRIFGRGVGDDKGQWFAHLCAIKAFRDTSGLPVDVTLLLEGEEEISSPNLHSVVRENSDRLESSVLFAADGTRDYTGRPELQLGSRGILYVEVTVDGPTRDVHSALGGSIIPNPAEELTRIISRLKDEDGYITIDGYYDELEDLSRRDREVLADMPFDAESVKEDLGIRGFSKGPGDTPVERLYYKPTLNVAGLESGYTGEGAKTITPARSTAKIDMRLCERQHPDEIFEKFVNHVRSVASDLFDVEFDRHGSMEPMRTPLDSKFAEPILEGLEEVWELNPILRPSTRGAIPWYIFEKELDIHCTKVPYANYDQRDHSPDENLSLLCFENGIRCSIQILQNLAQVV